MPQQVKDELPSDEVSEAASDTLLSNEADAGVQLMAKRRRGRPRKVGIEAKTTPAATDTILTTSADAGVELPAKRRRGRPCKVRTETETAPESGNSANNMPESIDDAAQAQDEGLASTMEEGIPQPMTLSLSPPPMPAGRVPQPAGVLLLPLYSSTPTEPGEQSSLMVVQPHQLANLPLSLGGQATGFGEPNAGLPPLLTPTQPILSPFIASSVSQPTVSVYTVPLTASSAVNNDQT